MPSTGEGLTKRPARPERDPVHLHHMLDLAREAVQLVRDRPRAELVSDRVVWHGLAYCLTRIGRNAECVSSEGRAALPEADWANLIETGELLIREYDQPHEQLVWDTATRDLPALIPMLERVLDDLGAEETVRPRDFSRFNARVYRELSWVPLVQRRAWACLVGMIETPFVVDQEEYFGGMQDPEELDDEDELEGEEAGLA